MNYDGEIAIGLGSGGTINGDLDVVGDLSVVGNMTVSDTLTVQTLITEQELEVKDVLITCGIDNPADSSNLGLLEEYQIGGGTKRWAGLVRSFSDKTQYLLEDMAVKPTPGSDVTNLPRASLAVADLQISNYSMPGLDGTLGQVITSSGNGALTFQDPSSGTLQNSFDVSTAPQIVTDMTNFAIEIKQGSGAEGDILIVKNALDETKVALGSDGAIFGNSAYLDGGDLKISRNGDGATIELQDTGVVKWKMENISGDQFVLEDGSGNEFIRCAQNAIMSFQRPSAFEAGYIGLNGLGGAEFQFQNTGDTTWVLNSDGDDKFLLRSPLGTAIEIDQANVIRLLGQVKIGSGGTPYTMPSARGTAGQVLIDTLGNGDVSWEDEKGSSETLQEAYDASSIPHLVLPAEGLVLKSGVPGPPGLILDCRDFLDNITCRISRDGTGYFARTVSFDEEAYLYAGLVIGDISTVDYYRPPANNIGALEGDVLRYDATARQLKFTRQRPNNFSQVESTFNNTGTTDQIEMLGIGLGYRTILANALEVGSTFHVKTGGKIRNANTSGNLRLRLFLGGNLVGDTLVISLPFISVLQFWECEFDITFKTIGAALSVYSAQFTAQDGTTYIGRGHFEAGQVINSEVDNIWTMTTEWATANVLNILEMQQFYVSQII